MSTQWNCTSRYISNLNIPGLDYKKGGRCVSINETIWSLATRPWQCHINVENYFPPSSLEVKDLHPKPSLLFTYRSIRKRSWLDNTPKIHVLIHDVNGIKSSKKFVLTISGPVVSHGNGIPLRYTLHFIFDMTYMKYTNMNETTAPRLQMRHRPLTLDQWLMFYDTSLINHDTSDSEEVWRFIAPY